ncbi:MAG: lipopolysaccharide heptosyltransferase II [Chloroflexi bacterium]|nr:lipopolysaccharide heptosyltransferase II [Chloroflexota bacterium]
MQRKRTDYWREEVITLACQIGRNLFDSPRQIRGRPIPSLLELPDGARIAIIKPCCLGDVVLSTPLIRAINEARPDFQLDFVVSAWAKPVLEHNPRLRNLIDTGFEGSSFSLRQYLNLIQQLRSRKYQAALVLDRSPLLALLPWLAGIPLRAGLDSRGRGFALNLRAKLEANDPLQHEAEIYLGVARVAGIPTPNAQAEFYPGEASKSSFRRKAAELGLDLGQPLVVIHPGGGHNPDTVVLSKRWPAPNFGEIAQRLAQSKVQVVFIGASSDRELAERALKVAGSSPRLINAVEKFNLAESGALFEQAGLFVGNDTGLMHLAVACDTPTVAIFGPSSPVAYGPFTAQGRAVSPLKQFVPEGLPLNEYQALSVAEGGIAGVTINQVWEAIQLFLPVKSRPQSSCSGS